MPPVEIGERPALCRELSLVALQYRRVELEAKKSDALICDECLDCRDVNACFLYMEDEVATFARREKIVETTQAGQRRFQQLLPAAPDFGRRRAEALSRDEFACGDDVATASFTVKSKVHKSALPDQREQDAPGFKRIGHVMEYTGGIDDIKAAANRCEIENISLRIVDVRRERCRCIAFGIAEAAQAQIHGEHMCAQIFLRGCDSELASSAAGNEHVESIGLSQRNERRQWELLAQILIDRFWRDLAWRIDPSRIGIFFILLANLLRDIVFDRRQTCN